MKRIISIGALAIFLILMSSCGEKTEQTIIHNPATAEGKGASTKEDPNGPRLTFDKTTHDFGTVIQGEKLTYTFNFTNTGKAPLVIENAAASCGCTTSTPPKAPIKPGESGKIDVTFDSKTKSGAVETKVRVVSNSYPTPTVLTIKANVKKP